MTKNERAQLEVELKQFVERFKNAASANLHSIVLYGSAVSSDFHENFSDVNLLCLLHDVSAPAMVALSDTIAWWKKQKQSVPLLLSVEELTDAADVFAIELLDMKRHHRILHGEDLIAHLDVPLRLHRVQVEHELRTKLILLRQTFLTRAAHKQQVLNLMLDSVSSFVTLFRHALIAMGEEPESSRRAMLQQLHNKTNVDISAFLELLSIREGALKADALDGQAMFPSYLRTVESVISALDRL